MPFLPPNQQCQSTEGKNFDPENKVQSISWKHVCSPPSRKLHIVALSRKLMVTVFWDADGIVLTILRMAAPSQEHTTVV